MATTVQLHDVDGTVGRAPSVPHQNVPTPPSVATSTARDVAPPRIAPAPDVMVQLRALSESYAAAIAQVDSLRREGPHADSDAERVRRADLVDALHRVHALRERRSALLEMHNLPTTTGYTK